MNTRVFKQIGFLFIFMIATFGNSSISHAQAEKPTLTASVEAPLSEATLDGSVVTLTLTGGSFGDWAVSVSGIEGVTFYYFRSDRLSDTQITIKLEFAGDIDTDTPLVFTVGAEGIAGYDGAALTAQLPVTAVVETLAASVDVPLSEAMLDGSVVTLTLSGRSFGWWSDIEDAVSVSGIEGVTVNSWDVDRVSDTQITVELEFAGDIDTDTPLVFTVGADAIAGYSGETLTAQLPVTAIKQSKATMRLSPNPIVSPLLGKKFTVDLNITGGENVAGFQATVAFDKDTLRYVESAEGDYLPANPFFDANKRIGYSQIRFAATALEGVGNGDGRLATLTFEVIDVRASMITLSKVYIADQESVRWEVEVEGTEVVEPADDIVGDVNRDGVVNIQDLILVHVRFGLRGENRADINSDGIVDIVDLVLVANALGADAAAPALNPQILAQLTAAEIKHWLTQAQQLNLTDPAYLRGVDILEQLLAALTPKETALLANYPNPFNPETWIPYQLSKPTDVTLTIYDIKGSVVRALDLGHQRAGIYQNRSRAAYWDGRNAFGEPVASGVYFYTLTAGGFTATRKMLIRK